MMDDQKPNPQQHKLIMFSCPVSVLVSQTKSLKPYYEPLGTPTQKPILSMAYSEYT